MAIELRKTGINVVGDVPWGTHMCHFYETKADLLDILIPYFKVGLENNEFCIWVVADPLGEEEAREAVKQVFPDALLAGHIEIVPHSRFRPDRERTSSTENIEIIPHTKWYLHDGAFIAQRVLSEWTRKLGDALAKGYVGLRANGNEAWLTEENWRAFSEYEKTLDESLAGQRMIVLCSYPLSSSSASQIFDVVETHQLAVVRRSGKWQIVETPESKQAKQEIKRLNAELEQRISERTTELAATNAELRKEIADRKQSEVELSLAHQRLSYLVENTPLAVIEWDKDRFITRWSKRAEEVFGWKTSEALGMNLYDPDFPIVYEEDARAVEEIDGQLIEGTVHRNLSLNRNYTKDGNVIYCEWYNSVLRDENGNVITILSLIHDITERQRAEDALRASEDRLRLIIDTIPVMAWTIQPDGKVEFINQRWLDYAGLTWEQYVRDPNGAVHPEDKTRVIEKWRAALAAGEPYEAEMRLRRADGEYRWFLVRVEPLRDEQGMAVKWYGVSTDIGERKQVEEKLKLSESQLAEAQRLAHVGSWNWDLQSNVSTWSVELYRIYGVEPQAFNPGDEDVLREFIHVEDRSLVRDAVESSLKTQKPFSFYYRIHRADGEERVIHSRGDIVSDEHGKPLRMFGTAQDVTERKQAEEKLKQSENQLAEAQRLAHVGGFDWDLQTNNVTWSEELYRIFGLEPGGINIAGDAMSFIHPHDRDRVWSTVQRSVENREPYSFYYRVLRPDGDERIVHTQGRVLSDEDGHPRRVFGATQDVTELKRAEEQLKVVTEQLRALSASLESAREEEGTRIARELHDELGSALTSLRWSLDEIHSNLASSAGKSDANPTRSQIAAMIALVEGTLNTVRRISSELRPTMLDDLGLAAAIEWQAQQFQARTGISCTCDCSVENAELSREQSTAVFRILQEALTNVLRHAHATRVDIKIEKHNGYFVLSVTDNGKGITEREKLGILGMRERAHLIGAEIQIKRARGQGTLVNVRVPISGSDKVS